MVFLLLFFRVFLRDGEDERGWPRGTYRYIDAEGEFMEGEWADALNFSGDRALVWEKTDEGKQRAHLIGPEGTYLEDREWDYIDYNLDDGTLWIGEGYISACAEGYWGFIDAQTGKTAVEPVWKTFDDECGDDSPNGFKDGRTAMLRDGLWYVIDRDGNVISK